MSPGKPVHVWKGLPPDKKYSAFIEMGENDFFKVYSGCGWGEVAAMVLAGRIKVHWLRYDELRNFSLSYDFSPRTWLRFFHSRGEFDREAALWRRQWQTADAMGWLVNDDGEPVDPTTLTSEQRTAFMAARTRWMEPIAPPSESLPIADPLPPPSASMLPPITAIENAVSSSLCATDSLLDEGSVNVVPDSGVQVSAASDSTACPSAAQNAAVEIATTPLEEEAPASSSVLEPTAVCNDDTAIAVETSEVPPPASLPGLPTVAADEAPDLASVLPTRATDTSDDVDFSLVEHTGAHCMPGDSGVADLSLIIPESVQQNVNVDSGTVEPLICSPGTSPVGVLATSLDEKSASPSVATIPPTGTQDGRSRNNATPGSFVHASDAATISIDEESPPRVVDFVESVGAVLAVNGLEPTLKDATTIHDVLELTSLPSADADFAAVLRGVLDQPPPSQALVGAALVSKIDVHSTTIAHWLRSGSVPVDELLNAEATGANPVNLPSRSCAGDVCAVGASDVAPTSVLDIAGEAVSSTLSYAYAASVAASSTLWSVVVGGGQQQTSSIAVPFAPPGQDRFDMLRSASQAFTSASVLAPWAHFRFPGLDADTTSKLLVPCLRRCLTLPALTSAIPSVLQLPIQRLFTTFVRGSDLTKLSHAAFRLHSNDLTHILPSEFDACARDLRLSVGRAQPEGTEVVPSTTAELLVGLCGGLVTSTPEASKWAAVAQRDDWLSPVAQHWHGRAHSSRTSGSPSRLAAAFSLSPHASQVGTNGTRDVLPEEEPEAAAREQRDVDAYVRSVRNRIRGEAARAAEDRAFLLRHSLAGHADVLLWGVSHPLLPPPILVPCAKPFTRSESASLIQRPHVDWGSLALGVPLFARALRAVPLIAPALLLEPGNARLPLPSLTHGLFSALSAGAAGEGLMLGPVEGEALAFCLGVPSADCFELGFAGPRDNVRRPLLTLGAVSLPLAPSTGDGGGGATAPTSVAALSVQEVDPDVVSGSGGSGELFLLPLWHPRRLKTPGAADSVPPGLWMRHQPLVYAGSGSGLFAANAVAAVRLRCDVRLADDRPATLPASPSLVPADEPREHPTDGGGGVRRALGRLLSARRAQFVEFLRERAVKLYPPRPPPPPPPLASAPLRSERREAQG